MGRRPKFIPTPSRLSQILADLKKEPRPQLTKVKGLKITYAIRNDHWGVRHFVQDDLPRIRYANPRMNIAVDKKYKTKEEMWKPELVVELTDGTTKSLDVDGKWSHTIFQEIMDLGGGQRWEKWKAQRTAEGLPIVEAPVPKPKPPPKEPRWRPGQSTTPKPKASASASPPGNEQQATGSVPNPFRVPEKDFLNPGKTGAAAVLP